MAIIMMCLGLIWGVKVYLDMLKGKWIFAYNWEKIFRLWKSLIARFSYSISELLDQTTNDVTTKDLEVIRQIQGLEFQEIKKKVNECMIANEADRQVVEEVLDRIGSTVTESEIESLAHAIELLEQSAALHQASHKEKKILLYKLLPLLCGAIAILFW